MLYQELLSDPKWQEKRLKILRKDSFVCQECFNLEFQNVFNSGLIMSNQITHGAAQNSINGENYLLNIWDIQNSKVELSFLNKESNISLIESYIAFYDKSKNYANIFALKKFDSSKIDINKNITEIIKFGIRGKFTDITNQEITSIIKISDKWAFVKGLHVHHTYYQYGIFPWEYPDNSLKTLCWSCHEKLHQNKTIPVLNEKGVKEGELTYCPRCHGAGIFPEYMHVESGICFECHGKRYKELSN